MEMISRVSSFLSHVCRMHNRKAVGGCACSPTWFSLLLLGIIKLHWSESGVIQEESVQGNIWLGVVCKYTEAAFLDLGGC